MSIISEILRSALHGTSHVFTYETMENLHRREELNRKIHGKSKGEEAWNFEIKKMKEFKTDKKNQRLHEQLENCLNKNYIPIEILSRHLFFVVHFCIEKGREDLVKDYLPYYKERQKNFKKVRMIKVIVFFFESFIPFLLKLFLFLIIILIIYSVIWGAPDWLIW